MLSFAWSCLCLLLPCLLRWCNLLLLPSAGGAFPLPMYLRLQVRDARSFLRIPESRLRPSCVSRLWWMSARIMMIAEAQVSS